MLQTPIGDTSLDITKYQSYLVLLNNPNTPEENRLKAAQEISEHFEDIAQSPKYSEFLNLSVPNFIKLLQDGEPQFISEYPSQQLRKLVLDVLHRIPTNDHLRVHVKNILNLCFRLLEIDNEENVQVCIKIIIELHKQFRPQMAPEIEHFLALVKRIYAELPQNMAWLFENPTTTDGGIPDPQRIGTITPVQYRAGIPGNPSPGGKTVATVIPKGLNSMKVLQEIPITVVLMYQLYKQATQSVVAEFIPLIMKTLLLQPSPAARSRPNFNSELFVDFTAAQVKTLSFVAFFVRLYHEKIIQYSNEMVQAMLQLLQNCSPEVASLRKELLIAVRHILATDLKTRFVPHMDRLLNEDILVGTGWSARETLRTLAYSTLADVTHQVKGQLSLSQLCSAVHLFAKNVHDDSLSSSFQAISCKLLLNLVEGITSKSESEKCSQRGREMLMKMIEVFVLKFRTISKHTLPALFARCKRNQDSNTTSSTAGGSGAASAAKSDTPQTPQTPAPPPTPTSQGGNFNLATPTTPSATAPPSTPLPNNSKNNDTEKDAKPADDAKPGAVSVADCRSLVRSLVCGVKTISWGAGSCNVAKDLTGTTILNSISSSSKRFFPEETALFVKLVKYALKALDIYQINVAANGQMTVRPSNCPTMRMKEEKEVLEHFASVFTMMHPLTFREIFSSTITYVVDRIYNNYALQIVANAFLASLHTSPTFATILVEFLLERLADMGVPGEKSNLYLKLFKLVFGSVSLFASENEQMLKPHLHTIVTKSMSLANTAQDPYNYFLLLRALFRSIGGGSHDSLYQEFLPLLPNLLQGLNSLQSGLHKQHMKDLFVELCLTVPVRLSSLLPYLPMLMDPLVSALNGSQTLITQGLRTLELCVDNLQPDFLYDHIQPVRAELMQALWRTLRNPSDDIAHVAFRVLGKFGGSNRKMLKEAQSLAYDDSDSMGPCLKLNFKECKTPIQLPVREIIASALKCLKSPNTEPFYRRQSFEVIKCFLIGMMNADEKRDDFSQLLQHASFTKAKYQRVPAASLYKCQDTITRNAFKQALTGAFMCAVIKDLRKIALPFVAHIVRHYTLVAIAQQAGPFPVTERQQRQHGSLGYGPDSSGFSGMDPLVVVDAVADCMAYEEKELCKIGNIAILLMIKVSATVMGSSERAANLPLFSYIAERMCACCYDRAWYSKYGGCSAIKYLMEMMPVKWVLEQQYAFLRALFFVMMDLTNEVSSGAVDLAKEILKDLLVKCSSPLPVELARDPEAVAFQKSSFNRVMHELVREVTSPNQLVREQAINALHTLAKTFGGRSVSDIMVPHCDVLADMIPPRKHLLRHQPVNTQIGLVDGNTFCNSLRPRIFTLDLEVKEHKVFFTELFNICEADDAALRKLACYKSVGSLVPLRISAMKALSVLYYIPQVKEKIVNVLFKQLGSESAELMKTAEECIAEFLKGTEAEGKPIETDVVHNAMRPTLLKMGDYRNLTLAVVHHLAALSRLFPNTFNEKLCEQLFAHLNKWLDTALLKQSTAQSSLVVGSTNAGQMHDPKVDVTKELKLCAAILEIFHLIPLAPQALLQPLIALAVKTESGLMMEIGSPLRDPLLRFLTKHPDAALNIFLQENNASEKHWNRMLIAFLKRSDKNGQVLREKMEKKTARIMTLCFSHRPPEIVASTPQLAEFQYLGIQITWLLAKHNPKFLTHNVPLIKKLHEIWINPEFHRTHEKDNTLNSRLDEPRLLCKCLLKFGANNSGDVGLQFQLLRAFSTRNLADFQFLHSWFEEHVPCQYTTQQKRMIFFKFAELYHDANFPSDLKALAIQHILMPIFKRAFDVGEGEQLIGGPPNPETDSPTDCISVFVNRVIDPDKPYAAPDAVQIQLLRFLSLLVDRASAYIHDPTNKRHGNKLRRIMTFAWPCLLPRNCVDPASKYHGHLLLSHIIARFAIRKRIVLQTFYSLLKAHALEARAVVRQALDILTPAMPARMEDGNQMLTHWTRKIIVEEGHTLAQLMHVLQLVVRHHKVYYPVNSALVQQLVASMQRLGFAPNTNLEQRRLAVDVAEVLIKWEKRRKEDDTSNKDVNRLVSPVSAISIKMEGQQGSTSQYPTTSVIVGIDKKHSDTVINFLLRMTCQVYESSGGAAGEQLSRRCVALLHMGLRSDLWPNADLHLLWLDKLLRTVDPSQQGATGNICTGLELLNLVLSLIPKETVVSTLKPLQSGVAACMTSTNVKVIRSVHGLLARLFGFFPPSPSGSSDNGAAGDSSRTEASQAEKDLEMLYSAVAKTIAEGLSAYEKSSSGSPAGLFSTLMILKAACSQTPCYIDHMLSLFVRAFQKLVKEHLQPHTQGGGQSSDSNPILSELVIVCLDLVKHRVATMSSDTRRTLINVVLVQIIEKSPDAKLLKAVIRIVDEWLKAKTAADINQSPSLREKSLLLMKLMNVEKRFPDQPELHTGFLDLVNYVYRDEALSGTELTAKLEPAFLAGLRCFQPATRKAFFEVFDNSVTRSLYDRMLYVTCAQNWEAMGSHYWIKQCIELFFSVCDRDSSIIGRGSPYTLPAVTHVITVADVGERAAFNALAKVKTEPMDIEMDSKEEEVECMMDTGEDNKGCDSSRAADTGTSSLSTSDNDRTQQLTALITRHSMFLESLSEARTISFLLAATQLCHHDTQLAHTVWCRLFPRMWNSFTDRQQTTLSQELSAFVCSGAHLVQQDCQPSSVHTIVEAMSKCVPAIPLKPPVIKYLGKTHNLWFRCVLMLEQLSTTCGVNSLKPKSLSGPAYEAEPVSTKQQGVLDALCDLYSLLREEDMWTGLWQRRCLYSGTAKAMAYEQQGFFEQAQLTYEGLMGAARDEHNNGPAPNAAIPEYKLWEDHWIRCCQELNQWEILNEYGSCKSVCNPHLVVECAWRLPDWNNMKDALVQVEMAYPKELAWKVYMYRGFLAICHPEEHHINLIERLVDMASSQAIKEWKRIPRIVSHVHTPLLQAAQQIIELQEAAQIHQSLQPSNIGRSNSLHDMKAIVKTWRNRLPMTSDDLSHWSDIFTWRHHHYQAIVQAYDTASASQQDPSSTHAMLGVHASASAIIHYGKVARKHGQINSALDSLSRIHAIPSVPIVDCFQKIRQQVKCYLQMAAVMGRNECMQGLEVIESTNLKYFSNEMTAEFYALKGMFLAQIGKSDEANKAFSAAVQMHDHLVKAWALWGDYLETIFVKNGSPPNAAEHTGVSAITCYLHACRHQNEHKSRKYLAKVIWLLSCDDAQCTLAEAVDKFSVGVPPIQWLAWVPQLLTCLICANGGKILNLLSHVARVYPQAVYFPIRTLYLTLKIEQRERYKSAEAAPSSEKKPKLSTDSQTSESQDSEQQDTQENKQPSQPMTSSQSASSESGPIRATPSMWRCSRIMHMQRDLHPTLLSSLEGIVDQMVWFRENWHEEVLRQLCQGLVKCYSVAFENRVAVSRAQITPHTLNFVRKLVSTFGVGIENVSNVTQTFSSAASESLARRVQATAQDPVFQKMKIQFTTDFDFSVPGSTKLHNVIQKLKKWIKILEAKTKMMSKSFLIEEKCRFLSNFSASTAQVDIPGEYLMPKHTNYYVKIARFMPRVHVVQKHNTAARRLYIRGHNGKIYPYLVMNDGCLIESRREERVLQLLRLLNPGLERRKETAKRQLLFSVPRVVAVSPQMRLVEDNPSSLSLLDIYKLRCAKKSVEHDAPISRYYERLTTVQARSTQVSHQVLRDILKDVQNNMVPRSMLREWAVNAFPDATDYWTFRKSFTLHTALLCFAEFALYLTRLKPEMLQIGQDSGHLHAAYFRFDVSDKNGELNANRPVLFRLTPNIAEFISPVGVSSVLTAAIIATARCFMQPNFMFEGLLGAVLRDEMISWHKKRYDERHVTSSQQTSQSGLAVQPPEIESDQLVTLINRAVTSIMNRLQTLATMEGGESKVTTLVAAANSVDNLCRMDPAWHPWL